MPGLFSEKVIDFTDKPSMWWCSFVENTFADYDDTQLVTNRSDRNTYCTVSEGNSVSSLVFWELEPYNLIQLLMHVGHWPRISKEFQLITKNM